MKIHETNRQNAIENITTKIKTLQLIAQGDHTTDSEIYYPKTIRQFNFWTTTTNPGDPLLPNLKRNANATLNQHPSLVAEIKALIEAIRKKSSTPLKNVKLNEKIMDHVRYIRTLEEYTATQKLQYVLLKEKMEAEVSRLNRIIAELKNQQRSN